MNRNRSDLDLLQTFMRNIEIEREKLNFTQMQMANAIGMSLSSYKRMINGEMNLRASIVIKNLYFLTGKCCHEFMEIETPELALSQKVRQLNDESRRLIEPLIDYILDNQKQK